MRLSNHMREDFENRLPEKLKDCSTSKSFENKLQRIEVCKLYWTILSNSLVSFLVSNSWSLRFFYYYIFFFFFWGPCVDYREILSANLNKKVLLLLLLLLWWWWWWWWCVIQLTLTLCWATHLFFFFFLFFSLLYLFIFLINPNFHSVPLTCMVCPIVPGSL